MLLLVRSRSLLLTAFITSGKKGDILHAFDKFELIPRPKQQRNIPSSYLLILIEFCERSQRLNPCTVRHQSESYVQSYVTAIHEWISRMHEHRLTAFALRCSIRATATEMVAIAP